MGVPLHERQSLAKLAKVRQHIDFSEELEKFKRLTESITQDLDAASGGLPDPGWRAAMVRGQLEFGYLSTESDAVGMRGDVAVAVPAVCQRCMRIFTWPLSTTLHLVFNVDGKAAAGDEAAETWDVPDDVVDVADIVDEALVMALPFAAKHEDTEDCVPIETSGTVEDSTKPFADLKAQMELKKKFDDEQ